MNLLLNNLIMLAHKRNPAYRRQRISLTMLIVGPIQFERLRDFSQKKERKKRKTPVKPWENPGKALVKPRENIGKTPENPQENHRKTLGKPGDNPGKTPGKPGGGGSDHAT